MGQFNIRRHEAAESFLGESRDWLMRNEIVNNEILALAELFDSGHHNYTSTIYMATIRQKSQVCGCAVQALPDAFTVSDIPREMIKPLLMDRLAIGTPIEWLTAAEKDAEIFGQVWEKEFGKSWSVKYRWIIHAITDVTNSFRSVPGRLRKAEAKDHTIVSDWAVQYGIESPSPIDIPNFMKRKLDEGNLYIWDSGGPKTIMTISGQTDNLVRISAVYTPVEFRGNGFATAGVAALSQALLEKGLKYCTLTTNEAKPNTAKLYSSIGYKVVNNRLSIALAD